MGANQLLYTSSACRELVRLVSSIFVSIPCHPHDDHPVYEHANGGELVPQEVLRKRHLAPLSYYEYGLLLAADRRREGDEHLTVYEPAYGGELVPRGNLADMRRHERPILRRLSLTLFRVALILLIIFGTWHVRGPSFGSWQVHGPTASSIHGGGPHAGPQNTETFLFPFLSFPSLLPGVSATSSYDDPVATSSCEGEAGPRASSYESLGRPIPPTTAPQDKPETKEGDNTISRTLTSSNTSYSVFCPLNYLEDAVFQWVNVADVDDAASSHSCPAGYNDACPYGSYPEGQCNICCPNGNYTPLHIDCRPPLLAADRRAVEGPKVTIRRLRT